MEIPLEGDMVDESAWQECSGSNVSALRPMEYVEQNVSSLLQMSVDMPPHTRLTPADGAGALGDDAQVGDALANATASPTHTWTNRVYYDGVLVAVNDSRPSLDMGATRNVAGLPSGLAIPQVIRNTGSFLENRSNFSCGGESNAL